ncbi:MAG: NTP transferase domain-containing protein [Opitutales bacterium]|nr:NTP transferase domain-containing protein [Opitutales bacterium]
MDTPLYGLVLVGGRSQRMGQDKAWLDYRGLPQWRYLVNLLQGHCAQVYLSVHEPEAARPYGDCPTLVDRYAYPGPINGLLSAFALHGEAAWLVLACDLPGFSEAAISRLIRQRDRRCLATAFRNPETSSPEPLAAIWEPSSRVVLEEAAAAGQYSPRRVLEGHPVHCLHPENPRHLANVNTPAEAIAFRQQRSASSPSFSA